MDKKKRGSYKTKNVILLSKVLKMEKNVEDKEKIEIKKDGNN